MTGELPAAIVDDLATHHQWVRWAAADRNGKPTKLPFRRSGRLASTTDPKSWTTFAHASEDHEERRVCRDGKVELGPSAGLGFVLSGPAAVRGLDLDGCRDPSTGEITPAAQKIMRDFPTYTEVSPSGTGVKLFFRCDPVPDLGLNGEGKPRLGTVCSLDGGGYGDKHHQAELYLGGRYFAVTGQHLDGTPDEIVDCTEAAERLARWMQEQQPGAAPKVDLTGLPPELAEIIAADAKLAESWATGKKLGSGKGNQTGSGLDWALVGHLAWRGHPDELIELAVRHFPHGQLGSGKVTGGTADRQLGRLLEHASRTRDKAETWQRSKEWEADLVTTDRGEARDCVANVALVLRKEPVLVGRLAFDELAQAVVCSGLPWHQDQATSRWTGNDDLRLAEWMQRKGVPVRPSTVADGVAVVADEARFHPVRAYLDELRWDGVPRLDGLLVDNLGAADTALNRATGRKWLVSAVARTYQPGCKADHVLILEGRQGAGKSSALRALMSTTSWFADEIADLGSKDAAQDLRGKWLIEVAELSAMRRGEIERVKAFISREVDHYRPSYGRRSEDHPRSCIFAGTTNSDAYLGDETGARRFWPVKVGRIDLEALRRDRDQLWAEAVVAYRAGETWWLAAEMEAQAAEAQADRMIEDPWQESVLSWCAGQQRVTILEVMQLALGIEIDVRNPVQSGRVARILRAAGWERRQLRENGRRSWAYEAPASPLSPLPAGQVVTEKPSARSADTTVTTVTTCFPETQTRDTWPRNTGAVVPPVGNFRKQGVTSGDSGDTPPWTDDRAWIERLSGARNSTARLGMILEWGKAAGGDVSTVDEVLRLDLPALPGGMPLAQLRRFAREHRIDLRVGGRA